MKAFYRTSIALCVSLTILFLTIGAAAAAVVIEIRGPVYGDQDITNITTTNSITTDASNFAAFCYDLDDSIVITAPLTTINETLRYYPYVEKTIGNETTSSGPSGPSVTPGTGDATNTTDSTNTTTPF